MSQPEENTFSGYVGLWPSLKCHHPGLHYLEELSVLLSKGAGLEGKGRGGIFVGGGGEGGCSAGGGKDGRGEGGVISAEGGDRDRVAGGGEMEERVFLQKEVGVGEKG